MDPGSKDLSFFLFRLVKIRWHKGILGALKWIKSNTWRERERAKVSVDNGQLHLLTPPGPIWKNFPTFRDDAEYKFSSDCVLKHVIVSFFVRPVKDKWLRGDHVRDYPLISGCS